MRKPDEETLHILTEIEKAAIEAMGEAHPMVGARMLITTGLTHRNCADAIERGDWKETKT